MAVTHSFVSAKSDQVDDTDVRPSDWNANHVGDISDFYVIGEAVGGTKDGANTAFTIAAASVGDNIALFRNGARLEPGTHYTVSGTAITMLAGSIPESGDTLRADYLKTVS